MKHCHPYHASEAREARGVVLDAGDVAAIDLLSAIADQMPVRSCERDMVVCALLYLEGDRAPGGSVMAWWAEKEAA